MHAANVDTLHQNRPFYPAKAPSPAQIDAVSPDERDFLLLALWRAGDRRAGNLLIERHFDAVRRFFINSVSDRERQDLTQETFTRLLGALNKFEGRASFRTFTLRIARYVLCDHLRRRYRGKDDFDPLTHSVEDEQRLTPSRMVSQVERHKVLLECLRRLPYETKELLELYYWQGLPTRELGHYYGIEEVTVRGRLRTARLRLKAAVESCEDRPSDDDPGLFAALEELGRFFNQGPTAA